MLTMVPTILTHILPSPTRCHPQLNFQMIPVTLASLLQAGKLNESLPGIRKLNFSGSSSDPVNRTNLRYWSELLQPTAVRSSGGVLHLWPQREATTIHDQNRQHSNSIGSRLMPYSLGADNPGE